MVIAAIIISILSLTINALTVASSLQRRRKQADCSEKKGGKNGFND